MQIFPDTCFVKPKMLIKKKKKIIHKNSNVIANYNKYDLHKYAHYFLPNSFKFRVILSDFIYCTIISSSILYQTSRIYVLIARLQRQTPTNQPCLTWQVQKLCRSQVTLGQKCRLEYRSLCYGEQTTLKVSPSTNPKPKKKF